MTLDPELTDAARAILDRLEMVTKPMARVRPRAAPGAPQHPDGAAGPVHGRLVTYGAHGGVGVGVDTRLLYRRHLSILGDRGARTDHP